MSDVSSAAPAAPALAAAPAAVESTAPVEAVASEEDTGEDLPEETLAEKQEKEIAKQIKKYNLKVNGKDKDVEFDLSNDKEIQKMLQKAMASDEKFQEASSVRKQVEQLIHDLKTNPLAILKHEALGIDYKTLAQQILNEEIEDMSKSPEQKRIEELELRLKQREEAETRLEEEKRQAEVAKYEQEAAQQVDDAIDTALDKYKLPRSPYVVKRIADTWVEALSIKGDDGKSMFPNITVDEIMPYVQEQLKGEFHKMFDSSPDDIFEELVGKKNLDRYRKAKISKTKAKAPQTAQQVKDTAPAKSSDTKENAGKKQKFTDVFGKW